MPTYVNFDVNVYTWVSEEADPYSCFSRDSTSGSVSINGAKIVKEDGYDVLGIDDNLHEGDTIHLVYATYSTGDSFGRDGGKYELLEICLTREEAESRRVYYDTSNDPSLPWNGHFESLEYVNVYSCTL